MISLNMNVMIAAVVKKISDVDPWVGDEAADSLQCLASLALDSANRETLGRSGAADGMSSQCCASPIG